MTQNGPSSAHFAAPLFLQPLDNIGELFYPASGMSFAITGVVNQALLAMEADHVQITAKQYDRYFLGCFRQDLFYRIKVVEIRMPTLVERGEGAWRRW